MGGGGKKGRNRIAIGPIQNGKRPDKYKENKALSAIHHDMAILMVGVLILAVAPVGHRIDLGAIHLQRAPDMLSLIHI